MMPDAKLQQTLQRITSIAESRVSDTIKREIGKNPTLVGISANPIAREFVSSQYLDIRNTVFQLPKVMDLEKRSAEAQSAGDEMLSKALSSDRETVVYQEITERLKALSLSVSRTEISDIPSLKKAMSAQIYEYRKRLWVQRTLNALKITAACACVTFGAYNIFKSID